MEKDKLKKVTKAHTIYKTTEGKRVPGTTTIVGQLAKPYLIKWANDLGLEGIDSSKYTDAAATVGTLAHAMIQAHLTGETINEEQYSPLDVDLAENALISYFNWEEEHEIKPIFCEESLVSDEDGYGGTVDCYCELDGVPTLLDFKTGKAVYDEYFIQLAAYKHLLEAHGYPVNRCMILRVGRDETEGFEFRTITDTRKYWEIFKRLLEIYRLKKEVGMK